jgi:predicted regulator of Ras-like GTPase activity (Roadblock/LC7/MglB family)
MDIDLVATEFTTLLRRSMRTATDTDLGELQEMVLASDQMTFLARPCIRVFSVAGAQPGGNVGRARFRLRRPSHLDPVRDQSCRSWVRLSISRTPRILRFTQP